MFGVSKSFSKCFTVAEHQGVELLSFPYLQELRIPWLSGAQYEFSGMTHNQRSSIIPATPDSLLSTSKAFAHQPLGQVHHWWPSGWRWPHRPQAPWLRWERGCWSFFLVIVARICFFCWGLSNCQSPYRYTVPARHLHINPSGKFIIGGPQGDAGLTGRKRLGSGESAGAGHFFSWLWHESVFFCWGLSNCQSPYRYTVPARHLHINPSGKFIIGGPQGDAGLTGRKRLGSGESAGAGHFFSWLWHESVFFVGGYPIVSHHTDIQYYNVLYI